MTEPEAIKYISRNNNNSYYTQNEEKKIKYVRECILKERLSRLGDDFEKEDMFTGLMINKHQMYLGIIPFDDRDNYINKRFETPGFVNLW